MWLCTLVNTILKAYLTCLYCNELTWKAVISCMYDRGYEFRCDGESDE